jgi:signal transduction histidine kinase
VRQHAEALEAKVRERTQQLEEANRKLEAASRHKSQFLANMSHELRTPLNAILGYTELIQDRIYGEVPEKTQEVLERVQKSGQHLLGLINDVLDLSKIEAGQLTLALSDYSLKDVVQTVVTAVQALAADKKVALALELSPNLPPGRGDERRITQVLLNLVGNAIKFTEVGEVRVRAVLANGAFLVSVSDTGPGIAPADQEKIFEEFQQADSSSTRKSGGTGLGLSIAKRIIELHGGASGWSPSPAKARPSGSRSRYAPSAKRRCHEQAEPGDPGLSNRRVEYVEHSAERAWCGGIPLAISRQVHDGGGTQRRRGYGTRPARRSRVRAGGRLR